MLVTWAPSVPRPHRDGTWVNPTSTSRKQQRQRVRALAGSGGPSASRSRPLAWPLHPQERAPTTGLCPHHASPTAEPPLRAHCIQTLCSCHLPRGPRGPPGPPPRFSLCPTFLHRSHFHLALEGSLAWFVPRTQISAPHSSTSLLSPSSQQGLQKYTGNE